MNQTGRDILERDIFPNIETALQKRFISVRNKMEEKQKSIKIANIVNTQRKRKRDRERERE